MTKAMAEMEREHWKKRWNRSSFTKLALNACWAHDLTAQSTWASERNSVVVGLNPTQLNFLCLPLRIIQWWIPYVSVHSAALLWFQVRDVTLKQTWRLMKTMVKMKREHETKTWNWISCTELALSASWTACLIARSVRASEQSSVVFVSNPTQVNFLWLLLIIIQ